MNKASIRRQKGYMLLGVMVLVTLLLVGMAAVLPRLTQQIKREKEEELIHRGEEYAMAIKRYYHASHGLYPVSLDQLESTNNMRFLRKRFKDPMTKDGEFKLVHLGEAQIKLSLPPNPGPVPNGQASTLGLSGTPTPTPSPSSGGMSGGGI